MRGAAWSWGDWAVFFVGAKLFFSPALPLKIIFHSKMFLFESWCAPHLWSRQSSLHSTMFLLLTRFRRNHEPCSSVLYIPLCFYSNCLVPAYAEMRYRLYIPLCLYFNRLAYSEAKCFIQFTFHYVSILMITLVLFVAHRSTFTFHYVSILIIYANAIDVLKKRLHSIMSLV